MMFDFNHQEDVRIGVLVWDMCLGMFCRLCESVTGWVCEGVFERIYERICVMVCERVCERESMLRCVREGI